jgi:PAP2 superfamily
VSSIERSPSDEEPRPGAQRHGTDGARALREVGRTPLVATLSGCAAGVSLFLVALLAVSGTDGLAPLDSPMRLAGRQLASGEALSIARIVTDFGALPAAGAVAVAGGLALMLARRPGAAAALLVGFATLVLAVDLLKEAIDRVRPPGASRSFTTASFPSGHAAYSVIWSALAVALVAGRPAFRGRTAIVIAAVGLTVAIGFTRVALGAHYLSDVVAGWALGAAVLSLSAAIAVVVGGMRNTDARSGATAPLDSDPRR